MFRVGKCLSTQNRAGNRRPSLNLNFQGGKLDSRVTFTRSTTGTFVGSNGLIQSAAINAPRFDYDPITLACKGLLIEEQRVNLLTYSEQFDNAVWSKNGVSVTANAAVAPNGTTTADKIIPSVTGGVAHSIFSPVVVSATNYALSFYAKSAGYTAVKVSNCDTGVGGAFDLATGAIGALSSGVTAQITAQGDGWYRCVILFTATAATSNYGVYVQSVLGTTVYAGNGTDGIFIFGAQLEAGAFATSYIPTVASQVTRTADNASMTGTNFSSWYNQSEGTVFSDTFTLSTAGGDKYRWEIGDGTTNNRFSSSGLATPQDFNVIAGGVNQGNSFLAISNAAPIKTAASYKVNDIQAAYNGILGLADTSATIPTVTILYIGSARGGVASLNGTIKSISYYPRRLTNQELVAITT